MTKLQNILTEKGMSQRDLRNAIKTKHNILLGEDRISRLVNGIIRNYHTNTCKIIADTLGVKMDDIIE